MTISVLGEALIDFIRSPNGGYFPFAGGSPFNVAIGLGRQDVSCCFLSPLSRDSFGQLLFAKLQESNVQVAAGCVSHLPTSLAIVSVDEAGLPTYSFYREGVADRDLDFDRLVASIPDQTCLLHTGSLAITPADVPLMARVFDHVRAQGKMVSIDINIRMDVVPDSDEYLRGIESLLPHCDIVKASDEDLAWFGYSQDPYLAAQMLQEKMGGGLVALTVGVQGAALLQKGDSLFRPAFNAGQLVDTVGAGDTFHAALLSSLLRMGLLRAERLPEATLDQLGSCLEYACCAAGINVTRHGCQPPGVEEVQRVLEQAT